MRTRKLSIFKTFFMIFSVFVAGFCAGWIFEVLDHYIFRKIILVPGGFNIWMPQFWKLF